jgi:hypothetical protein
MKKHFKSLLTVVFLMAAVIVLNSCSDDEVPANVIEDGSGLTISLDWTTTGSTSDEISLDEADIDLYLYHDQDQLEASTWGSQFEQIFFDDATSYFADGTYVVKVKFYYLADGGTYTLKVNGQEVTKSWSFDRSFVTADEDDTVYVSVLQIKKAGNKYTMTEID